MKKTTFTLFCTLVSFLSFNQEIRSFRENQLYGFKKGQEVVIPAVYEYASEFYGSLALVKVKGLWGYIDQNNHMVVQPKYDQAQPMVNGRARVYKNGKTGLIDSSGSVILETFYDKFEEDYSGLAIYREGKKELLTDAGTFI